jgi:signal transduction histidine kinase
LRTTAAAVAVVGLALLLGAVALVGSLRAVLTDQVRAAATLRAGEVADALGRGGDPVALVADDDDLALQVLSPAGEVVAASPNAAGQPPLVRLSPGESRVIDVPFDDEDFLAVAVADDGRTVLLARNLDLVIESTRTVTILLAIGLPGLLLVVAATTWRVVGRALAPIDAIRAEVEEISAAQLHRRVPQPPTGDEISRLAATMNRMLDRLQQSRARERQFVSDASHELRSPVATIRQHAEVALAHPARIATEALARTAHAESLRIQALVDDLLLLARADEHTLRLRRRPVDLDDLVLAEAERLRGGGTGLRGGGTGLRVDTSGVSAARVDGDPEMLRRVLRNLVDNAARYSRGRIGLTLAVRDGWAVLHVDDDGPGVPAADRLRVFERFVRVDDARARTEGGSGLGLAIVAEIVAAHGGSAIMEDSPTGGARGTVRLPLPA